MAKLAAKASGVPGLFRGGALGALRDQFEAAKSEFQPKIDDYDLRALRAIGYGAEPIPRNTLEKALARFGPILTQNYGLTEAMMTCITLSPQDHFTPDGSPRIGALGRAFNRFAAKMEQALTRVTQSTNRTNSASAQLTDVDSSDVAIGMPVEMVTRKLRVEGDEGLVHYGYKFRPVLAAS